MRRYLLVDDNRALAENLAEILRDNGDEVAVATSGQEALVLVRASRFDVMVTDMKMPVMGGAQLVHEVQTSDQGLPAIVITAYTGEKELQGAKQQGLLAVLPKPVPVPHLLELLACARRDALVALVEDDVALSENLEETLREHGFSAVAVRSVNEVVQLPGVKPFAALVDLRLPGSPQGEVLAALEQKFGSMPLLVMTGFPELGSTVKKHAVFVKPFETARVLETLERLYGERAAHV